MIIGLISDTHDHVPNIQIAADYFRRLNVELVLHAGDYCSPFTIPYFEGLKLHGIFGNNDGDKYLLMKKFEAINGVMHGDFYETELDGVKVALYHGTYPGITASLEKSGLYDVVVSGHTHEPNLENIGSTLSINPGSAHGFEADAMVATLDTKTRKVKFKELDEH
jgi:uncharacterized protein